MNKEKYVTFQVIYSMLLYLRDSGRNQRKTKSVLIDCYLSLTFMHYDKLSTLVNKLKGMPYAL